MTHQNPNPQADDAGKNAGKSKRPREYFVEARYKEGTRWFRFGAKNDWYNWKPKGYRTEAERDAALHNAERKYTFLEFRKA